MAKTKTKGTAKTVSDTPVPQPITISSTNPKIMADNIKKLEKAIKGADDASEISYDNTESHLTASNVQAAIDEVVTEIGSLAASDVSYDNTDSGLTATNTQAAIDEVNTKGIYQPGETVNIDYALPMGISNGSGTSLSVMMYLPKEVSAAVSNIGSSSLSFSWVKGGTATNPAIDKVNLFRPNVVEITFTGTFTANTIYTAALSGSFTLPSA